MRVAVIGANGNLGSRLVTLLLDQGHDVIAYVYKGECLDQRAQVIEKNLFDLTREEIEECDVLLSAFGGGFHVDPVINKNAFLKYKELLHDTNKRLIAIAGAGSLYVDHHHDMFEYQSDKHPEKLKQISLNIRLGVDELKKDLSFDWVVVCPSRKFDLTGPYTGQYIIGQDEEVIYNDDQESYVTYDDLAKAMVDITQTKDYSQKVITVATKTLK